MLNVEKVVNPPQIPTVKKSRSSSDATKPLLKRALISPMIKLPIRLTDKVVQKELDLTGMR